MTRQLFNDLMVIDIETVTEAKAWAALPMQKMEAWEELSERRWPKEAAYETYIEYGALFPEFSKIVCFSLAWWADDKLTVQGFKPATEKDLLKQMKTIIDMDRSSRDDQPRIFAGHAIGNFDIPFIGKRCIINGLDPIRDFDLYGRVVVDAPFMYSTEIYDTLQKWSFGTNNRTSLRSLCAALGVFDPKAETTSKDVHNLYYESGDKPDLEKISRYCSGDVYAEALCIYRLETGRHWDGETEEIT